MKTQFENLFWNLSEINDSKKFNYIDFCCSNWKKITVLFNGFYSPTFTLKKKIENLSEIKIKSYLPPDKDNCDLGSS